MPLLNIKTKSFSATCRKRFEIHLHYRDLCRESLVGVDYILCKYVYFAINHQEPIKLWLLVSILNKLRLSHRRLLIIVYYSISNNFPAMRAVSGKGTLFMKKHHAGLLTALLIAAHPMAFADSKAPAHAEAADHAKDAHAEPAGAGKSAPAAAAVTAAVAAPGDHGGAGKPADAAAPAKPVVKKKAKLAKKPAPVPAATAVADHGDAHAAPKPSAAASAGDKRVHVKDRAALSTAVAAAHANDHAAAPAAAAASVAGHDAHADSKQDAAAPAHANNHADSHATPPAAAPVDVRKVEVAAPAAHAAPVAHAAPNATNATNATNAHDSHAVQAAAECLMPLKVEVAALFDRWNAALKTGNPKKVVANYAPASLLLPTVSNKPRFTAAEKEDYFVHFLERKPEGKIDDRMIEVDCNSATDAGLYTFKFADGAIVKARYSFSYKKVGEEWLISSHHSSAMPEKDDASVAQAQTHTTSHASAKPTSKAAERSEQGTRAEGWVRFP
jgi:uncharacterized protein (TIGR02246 family)